MHKYSQWWCSADIWAQTCAQWIEGEFVHESDIATINSCGGAEKAKGTYKGGSIFQGQHIAIKVCMYNFDLCNHHHMLFINYWKYVCTGVSISGYYQLV